MVPVIWNCPFGDEPEGELLLESVKVSVFEMHSNGCHISCGHARRSWCLSGITAVPKLWIWLACPSLRICSYATIHIEVLDANQ